MRAALPYLALWLAALAAHPALAQQFARTCEQYEPCMLLEKCPQLNRPLHAMSQKDIAKLRGSLCGFEGPKPQVCCPILPIDECGPQNNADKIINGNKTVVNEFPWAVRLGYRRRREVLYQCGGALISARYVLTAAHCTRPRPVTVRLGEHDTESEIDCSVLGRDRVCAARVVDVDVEKVVSHPDFVPRADPPNGLYNDIALLRLRRAVPFTDSVTPVCLPLKMKAPPGLATISQSQSEMDMYGDYVLTVVGWGKIGAGEYDKEGRYLMKLNLRAVTPSECASKYSPIKYRVDPQRQLCCIGKEGTDVCSGDSGGPVTTVTLLGGNVRAVLRGLVSFGPPKCATKGVPAVHTSVIQYIPWILNNIVP